jgi:hypothetical protein
MGPKSEQQLLSGADSASALVLGFWGDDKVWDRCGADFVLSWEFGS